VNDKGWCLKLDLWLIPIQIIIKSRLSLCIQVPAIFRILAVKFTLIFTDRQLLLREREALKHFNFEQICMILITSKLHF